MIIVIIIILHRLEALDCNDALLLFYAGKGGPGPKSLWILFSIISPKPFQSMFIFLCQYLTRHLAQGWIASEGRKQDLNSGSFQSLWDVLTALWDSACHPQTRFWLWLGHLNPGSPSTPVRNKEWPRVELMCWEEQIKGSVTPGLSSMRWQKLRYFIRKEKGQWAEVGGWVCLTERACDPDQAKRPLS